jgi:hypothetical protein
MDAFRAFFLSVLFIFGGVKNAIGYKMIEELYAYSGNVICEIHGAMLKFLLMECFGFSEIRC